MLWRLYCNVMAAILTLLILKASLATAEVSVGTVAKADQNDDWDEVHYENIPAQRSPESSIGSDESMNTVILSKENVPHAFKTNDPNSTDGDTEESDNIVHGKQDCSTVKSITSYGISEEEYTGSLSILIVSNRNPNIKNESDYNLIIFAISKYT
jgi:hypothetical protein